MPDPTMRAARVSEGRGLEVVEIARPVPGPGEALVRIDACGLCGSDLHFYRSRSMPPGHTPGHEMAGVLAAVGANVSGLPEGLRVAVEPLRTCGECEPCRAGRDSQCRKLRVHGVHIAGGFAEYVLVDSHRLFALPQQLSASVAAMAEPAAVAIHGLRRGRLEKDQRVLIVGAGSVGLICLIAARQLGAGEVWITARHPHQAELARELGASRVLDESEASIPALHQLGRETDFDLVVETVGGEADTLVASAAALRPGGTISVLGVFMGKVEIDPITLLMKEGNLCFSNCYHHPSMDEADFRTAIELLESETRAFERLCTHQLPLGEIERAFEIALQKQGGAIKVTLLPQRD
jgi:threonine dehydrogenase-like Zn-dependent dehydrogenase